jgi:hypothetical protein
MTASCDLRKILRAAQARQDGGSLKVSAALKASTACMLGRGAQKKNDHLIKNPVKDFCSEDFNVW